MRKLLFAVGPISFSRFAIEPYESSPCRPRRMNCQLIKRGTIFFWGFSLFLYSIDFFWSWGKDCQALSYKFSFYFPLVSEGRELLALISYFCNLLWWETRNFLHWVFARSGYLCMSCFLGLWIWTRVGTFFWFLGFGWAVLNPGWISWWLWFFRCSCSFSYHLRLILFGLLLII